MLNTTHREILKLWPEMRRVVASVLRHSRYYGDDHIDECTQEVMRQAFDYGARTFDPSKGSAKSHFTTFAKQRAKNWLGSACRRLEVADEYTTGDEGETISHSESVPADGNPALSLFTAETLAKVKEALAALDERSQALVSAYLKSGSWSHAAREIGVSPATASRMKAAIVEAAQALAL